MKITVFFLSLTGLLVWLVSLYNALVALRSAVANAFAQIDVQLKRRYELIPNLVEVARGYLKHERETLQAVTEARNRALAANARMNQRPHNAVAARALVHAEQVLDESLARLMVQVEAYPVLQASESMIRLTEELATTENRVAFARQAYNDAVMHYNVRCESFPSSILAVFFAFRHAAMLQSTESEIERKAVHVRF